MLANDSRSVLVAMRIKPDFIEELYRTKNDLHECVEEIIKRVNNGEVVSKYISNKLGEGYSISNIEYALNRLVLGEVYTIDEALKGINTISVRCKGDE